MNHQLAHRQVRIIPKYVEYEIGYLQKVQLKKKSHNSDGIWYEHIYWSTVGYGYNDG